MKARKIIWHSESGDGRSQQEALHNDTGAVPMSQGSAACVQPTERLRPESQRGSAPLGVPLYLHVRRGEFVGPALRRVLRVPVAQVDGRHLALLQEGQQKQPLAQHGCKEQEERTSAGAGWPTHQRKQLQLIFLRFMKKNLLKCGF